MTIIFYLFGGIVEAGGIVLLLAVLASPALRQALQGANQFGSSVELMTVAAALAPGIGAIIAGLFLLAIAGVLSRLDSIKRYSRKTALALEGMTRGEAGN